MTNLVTSAGKYENSSEIHKNELWHSSNGYKQGPLIKSFGTLFPFVFPSLVGDMMQMNKKVMPSTGTQIWRCTY